MLEIKPATRAAFEEIYGYPPSRSIQGYAGYLDGQPVAIAGVYYYPDQCVAFCNITDTAKRFRHGLARGALTILKMIKDKGIPILAIADPTMPSAEDFLMRCGFQYLLKGPAGEVFVWHNHSK